MLENSVFFVILPLLRMFGGVGLGIISGDISGDESVHAAVHRQAAHDLGLTYSSSLDRLRRDTVGWLVDGLRIPEAGRSGKPQRWLDASDSLLYQGASDLVETRRAIQPAFLKLLTMPYRAIGNWSDNGLSSITDNHNFQHFRPWVLI